MLRDFALQQEPGPSAEAAAEEGQDGSPPLRLAGSPSGAWSDRSALFKAPVALRPAPRNPTETPPTAAIAPTAPQPSGPFLAPVPSKPRAAGLAPLDAVSGPASPALLSPTFKAELEEHPPSPAATPLPPPPEAPSEPRLSFSGLQPLVPPGSAGPPLRGVGGPAGPETVAGVIARVRALQAETAELEAEAADLQRQLDTASVLLDRLASEAAASKAEAEATRAREEARQREEHRAATEAAAANEAAAYARLEAAAAALREEEMAVQQLEGELNAMLAASAEATAAAAAAGPARAAQEAYVAMLRQETANVEAEIAAREAARKREADAEAQIAANAEEIAALRRELAARGITAPPPVTVARQRRLALMATQPLRDANPGMVSRVVEIPVGALRSVARAFDGPLQDAATALGLSSLTVEVGEHATRLHCHGPGAVVEEFHAKVTAALA